MKRRRLYPFIGFGVCAASVAVGAWGGFVYLIYRGLLGWVEGAVKGSGKGSAG